jgi:hypothetical protein
MTRSPRHERATGQAASIARARSVAAAFALGWGSTLSRCWNGMRAYRPGADASIQITLDHGYDLSDQAMEAAQLLTRLYLDPKGEVPPTRFWMEMHASVSSPTTWTSKRSPGGRGAPRTSSNARSSESRRASSSLISRSNTEARELSTLPRFSESGADRLATGVGRSRRKAGRSCRHAGFPYTLYDL